MTKTLQEISDRIEIEELFIKYAYGIDERQIDELDDVFLPDAVVDASDLGGPRGLWPEMKVWIAKSLAAFAGHQHIPISTKIEIRGDEAFTRTVCLNPLVT